MRYFAAVGYVDQQGLYPMSSFKKYSLRANLDATVNKNLDFAVNISGRTEEAEDARLLGLTNTASPINLALRSSLYIPGIEPVKYQNGTYHWNVPWVGNPMQESLGDAGYGRITRTILENSASLNYRLPFVPGLSVKALLAYDKTYQFNKQFTKVYTAYILNDDNTFSARTNTAAPSLTEQYSQMQSVTAEASVNYSRTFDNRHYVNALLLYTQTKNTGDNFNAARTNFASPTLDQLSLGSLVGQTNAGTGFQNARQGIVGRLNYNFDKRYLVDFNFRYDGSDVFPEGDRFGFFPSVGLGWVISEEKFFSQFNYLKHLKLRGSWGLAGNDRVGQFQYLSTYSIPSGGYPFGGTGATAGQVLQPDVIPNSSFTWEKTAMTNIGIEANLWDDKLTVEADYFNKSTEDILASRSFTIPALIGGTLPTENLASVDNKGIEISIGHQNRAGTFNYFLKGNFTYNKSKIVYLPEPPGLPEGLRLNGRSVTLGAVTGYKSLGYYQTDEEVTKGPIPLFTGTKAGDLKYEDVNGDGRITSDDRVIISKGYVPSYIYGLDMGTDYKGFDISMLWQGAADVTTQIQGVLQNSFHAATYKLWSYQVDRWTPDNPNASFPRLFINNRNNQQISSFFTRNASYLRLKSLELGYSLSPRVIQKIGINSLRVYLNGSNLLTFSSFKISDPERSSYGGEAYPIIKVFNAGLNLRF